MVFSSTFLLDCLCVDPHGRSTLLVVRSEVQAPVQLYAILRFTRHLRTMNCDVLGEYGNCIVSSSYYPKRDSHQTK